MEYTIGEIAEILNIAPSAIRYYEKEGLLPRVERSRGGVRKFSERELELLRVIECLKKTGMPLKDIKDFIYMTQQGDATIDRRLRLFEKQKEAVNRQIKELEDTLDIIDYKCWYYKTAREKGSTRAVENIPDSRLSPKLQKARNSLKKP